MGAAEKDGVELISVVLAAGQRGRWADTIKLMDYGFSQYVNVTPIDLYAMNPITIQTTNYSLSDSDMGRLALLCQPADPTKTASITATQEQVETMAENLRYTCLITYTRDFVAPIAAGEVMGVMTYFDENGNAVDYNLTASRAIAMRENAPKTLEQIVAETEADPNPFPPLTVELAHVPGPAGGCPGAADIPAAQAVQAPPYPESPGAQAHQPLPEIMLQPFRDLDGQIVQVLFLCALHTGRGLTFGIFSPIIGMIRGRECFPSPGKEGMENLAHEIVHIEKGSIATGWDCGKGTPWQRSTVRR